MNSPPMGNVMPGSMSGQSPILDGIPMPGTSANQFYNSGPYSPFEAPPSAHNPMGGYSSAGQPVGPSAELKGNDMDDFEARLAKLKKM
jgi:hypothetical protein